MRNKLSLLLTLAVLICSFHETAEAARTRPASKGSTRAESSPGFNLGKVDLGVGLASTPLMVNPGTVAAGAFATPALSGWFGFADNHAVQTYLTIQSTSPFNFGFGSTYKYTVSGSDNVGFHLGAGFGIGTMAAATAKGKSNNVFFAGFSGVTGLHFKIPSLQNILINLDAGPTLTVIDGDLNFALAGLSSFLGMSVHYVF